MRTALQHARDRMRTHTRAIVRPLTPTQQLAWSCRLVGLPDPVPEYRFWEGRKFAFDLAWPAVKVAVEVEGVTYTKGSYQLGGRHVSARGFRQDLVKYAEAAAQGWVVLRVLPLHIKTGEAITWVQRVLQTRAPLPVDPGATPPGTSPPPLGVSHNPGPLPGTPPHPLGET